MVMTSSRDETEILRIATTAVPSLGGGRAEAVHLDGDWQVVGSIWSTGRRRRPGCAALVNARLNARERAIADELRATNLALERAAAELALSSAAVQRSLDIHNRLTAVASAGEGQQASPARCTS